MTNWQEYLAGTDPLDPQSRLGVESFFLRDRRELVLGFLAVSNRSYAVQIAARQPVDAWSNLLTFPAETASRFIAVTNPTTRSSTRFYRLVTPAP